MPEWSFDTSLTIFKDSSYPIILAKCTPGWKVKVCWKGEPCFDEGRRKEMSEILSKVPLVSVTLAVSVKIVGNHWTGLSFRRELLTMNVTINVKVFMYLSVHHVDLLWLCSSPVVLHVASLHEIQHDTMKMCNPNFRCQLVKITCSLLISLCSLGQIGCIIVAVVLWFVI